MGTFRSDSRVSMVPKWHLRVFLFLEQRALSKLRDRAMVLRHKHVLQTGWRGRSRQLKSQEAGAGAAISRLLCSGINALTYYE